MGTGLEIAAFALAGIGAASSVYSAIEAKKDAKAAAAARERQARLQTRQREIAAQRQARLKRAQISGAAAAQGASSSITEGGLDALYTQLGEQQDILGEQLGVELQQIDIQKDQSIAQANAAIGQAVGSFAQTTLTPYGDADLSLTERAFGFQFGD